MVKKCAIKNCYSGSAADRKFKSALNHRQTTLFKNPDALQQWSLAMSQQLFHKNFICELHFNSDDILRNYEKINLRNDEVFELPRTRFALKMGAIPVLTNVAANVDTTLSNHLSINNDSTDREPLYKIINLSDNLLDLDQQFTSSAVVDEIVDDANCMENVNDELEQQILLGDNFTSRSGESSEAFSLAGIWQALEDRGVPQNWCWPKQSGSKSNLILYYIDTYLKRIKLSTEINDDLTVRINIVTTGVSIHLNYSITSATSFWDMLQEMENYQFCCGVGVNERSSSTCTGILQCAEKYKRFQRESRCLACRKLRKRLLISLKKRKQDINDRYITIKRKLHSKQKRLHRLHQKNQKLKEQVEELRNQFAMTKDTIIEEEIADLPEVQKQAVRACFQAAKAKNAKQRRYTIEWVYECLMIRIKGPAVYDKLRERQLLPLPCKDTLNKYINKLDSAFGFPQAIFDTLRLKASRMESRARRGTLLIDEISLSEAVKLNTKTMEFNGFVNLGDYTPQNLINERADHALVFMYQPFQGTWVQVLGYFLSKTAATKDILHKLIIDCIIQLENAGIKVDVVTSDGAQWNRGAWKIFGIEDQKFSCTHPHDTSRQLWFMSDFPHLLKCFRTKILEGPSFWTPDGIVKKIHWEVLLQHELQFKPNLKVSYKLTPQHINPEGYQKMNVRLAEELFSKPLRVAMMTWQNDCTELNDCVPTVMFMERVDNLIKAMSSRSPENALRPEECSMRKAIIEFQTYLREWEAKAEEEKNQSKLKKKRNKDCNDAVGYNYLAITKSTLTGLNITLGGTIELLNFLHEQCNFHYLMTARLNQDKLEQFFGIVRSACGCNEHPDPIIFGQVFRLLCSYSLVTPPKGSNVTAVELLESLMETKESLRLNKNQKLKWLQKIDSIIDCGFSEQESNVYKKGSIAAEHVANLLHETNADDADDAMLDNNVLLHSFSSYPYHGRSVARKPFEDLVDESSEDENNNFDLKAANMNNSCASDPHQDHDYDVARTSDYVVAYIAGYVARKMQRFSRCADCLTSLETDKTSDRDRVINLMSEYCIRPSDNLYSLIKRLETIVLSVVGTKTVRFDTMNEIIDKVAKEKSLPFVGCKEHESKLMKKILNYFITIRGHFLANHINRNYNQKKINNKILRKVSKLV